jgi:hypothetical protein
MKGLFQWQLAVDPSLQTGLCNKKKNFGVVWLQFCFKKVTFVSFYLPVEDYVS